MTQDDNNATLSECENSLITYTCVLEEITYLNQGQEHGQRPHNQKCEEAREKEMVWDITEIREIGGQH